MMKHNLYIRDDAAHYHLYVFVGYKLCSMQHNAMHTLDDATHTIQYTIICSRLLKIIGLCCKRAL